MSWRCEECNITFDSKQLYNTHKRKFCTCVDNKAGQLEGIQSKTSSSKSVNREPDVKEKNERNPSSMPLPGLGLHPSFSAPNMPSRAWNNPEFQRSLVAANNRHSANHLSAPNTPSLEPDVMSALERDKDNIGVIPLVRRSPVSRGFTTNHPSAPPLSVPLQPVTPASLIQRVESAPLTPSDESMIGLQVDKLSNAVEGEAKIKITLYDHEDGQVLKGENNSPVMCITKSTRQDFLEGIYSFGLQEARFKGVPWDLNSLVVLRLYLHPGDSASSGNFTAPAAKLLDESKLAAWTALPLALTAGSQTSSRQSQGDQGDNDTRLNVGTHELPLFFPPVIPVPNIPLKGPFPGHWSRFGEATLRISLFTALSPPPQRPNSPEEFIKENDLPENVWIKNGRSAIVTEEFEEGNGFDLYVDSARFLPDSVTVSKVAGRVLDKNYTRIGEDIDVQAELDSDIYHPAYNVRMEFREPNFSHSATLMLKVYTVNRISRVLCCVGYGFLPIFLEVGTTKQPSITSSEVKVALNEGPHQIRLYGSSPDLTQPLHESLTRNLPGVPCASLLVRVVRAASHPNGRPKEASQFKEREWEVEGLFQPKPSYSDGVYYSLSCEPTLGECQIFHSMIKRQPIRTRDAIRLIGDGQEQKLKRNGVIESWIKTQLTRSMDSLPGDLGLTYVALYHVTHGLQISVDAAQNIPWSNFTAASLCLSPPGSFYQGAVDDPLNFVSSPMFSSTTSSPIWREGFKAFPRRFYHKFMVLIVHVHELILDTTWNKPTYFLQGQAWTAVQVFDEGYVMNGCYQLPLYSGEPPEIVLNSLKTDNCQDVLASFRRKKVIKYLDSCSIFIRLSDARRVEELPAPKTRANQVHLPRERLDKYVTVNPSHPLSSLVPRGMSEDELALELSNEFKREMNQLLESHQKFDS